MNKQETVLASLIEPAVAGYWGEGMESAQASVPAFVVQNGDVGKDGKIRCENLVRRWFTSRQIAKAELTPEDIILVSSGAYTGNTGRLSVPDRGARYIASNFVRRIRPKGDVDPEFLFQMLRSEFFLKQLPKFVGGSAMPNLQSDFRDKCEFKFFPEPKVGSRVGTALRSSDCQIEATEALIAKQEHVRAGSMQDLFTRGVDENGELRPPREVAPHFYHETELGWLPKGWSAPDVQSLLADVPTPMRSGPFGSALLKHELVESGIPLLGIDNIHAEHFEASFSRFVTPRKFLELSRYRALPGDVVITIMGTVGRCCIIPDGHGDLLSSKHLWTMTFDQSKVIPELVCWQLNFAPWVLSWFRRQSQGGIMDAIQSSTLKRLRLPLPTLPEQERILHRYNVLSNLLAALRDELAKLRLQKVGLMQDLLTGTVSIEPLLEKESV